MSSKVDHKIVMAVIEQLTNCQVSHFGDNQTFVTTPIYQAICRWAGANVATLCDSQIVVIESEELWAVSRRI